MSDDDCFCEAKSVTGTYQNHYLEPDRRTNVLSFKLLYVLWMSYLEINMSPWSQIVPMLSSVPRNGPRIGRRMVGKLLMANWLRIEILLRPSYKGLRKEKQWEHKLYSNGLKDMIIIQGILKRINWPSKEPNSLPPCQRRIDYFSSGTLGRGGWVWEDQEC